MKQLITMLFLIVAITASSQIIEPFADLGIHKYGANYQAGVIINEDAEIVTRGVELMVGYSPVFAYATVLYPTTTTLLLGGFLDRNSWRLTASAGIAWYEIESDSKNETPIVTRDKTPAFKLKLGRESDAGQVYGYVSHFKQITYGLGLMVYPLRL